MTAASFNAIAAHPAVRPWLGSAPLDIAGLVTDPANRCFLTPSGRGGYIAVKRAPGLYSCHTLALPDGRGRSMLRLARAAFCELFTQTDCIEAVTSVPDGNRNALAWAKLAGFRETFRREASFTLNGARVGQQFFSLDFQTWALASPEARIEGQAIITAQAEALTGVPDAVEVALIGALSLCVKGGHSNKGAALYNRVSLASGHAALAEVSEAA